MMINGRSPVWHARRKKLLHMFNRWTNNFARIGTAYLHLTAGYTDIKMLIAKDLLLRMYDGLVFELLRTSHDFWHAPVYWLPAAKRLPNQ